MASRVVELVDVQSETAVRIVWPDDGSEPEARFLTMNRKALHVLPASVVKLAAAVLMDPSVLSKANSEVV